jgi:hypothetical protein
MPGKPDNVLGSGDLMPSLPGSREEEACGARQRPRGSAITVHVNESLGLQPRRESSLAQPRASRDHLRQPVGASAEDGALLEPVAPGSLPPGQHRASRWKSCYNGTRAAPPLARRRVAIRNGPKKWRTITPRQAVRPGAKDRRFARSRRGTVQRSSWVSWLRLPLTPDGARTAARPFRWCAPTSRCGFRPHAGFP